MSPAIVWGTRIAEEIKGETAINCPFCGEITTADCISVQSADHVYFIRGSFKETGAFLRCRLCGVTQEVTGQVKGSKASHDASVIPSQELLTKTNPELLNSKPPPFPIEIDLPKDVTRQQWALMLGISSVVKRQNAQDKVSGNTAPLLILSAMGGAIGVGFVWMIEGIEFRQVWTFLIVAIAALCLFCINKLHNFLVHRAVHREFSECLKRHMEHTTTSMPELIAAADALGKDFRAARNYLDWASRRTT